MPWPHSDAAHPHSCERAPTTARRAAAFSDSREPGRKATTPLTHSRLRQTSELLPIARIAGDTVRLSDGGLRAVLDCVALASRIRGDAEQSAVVEGWAELLNRLTHPLEIVIRSRPHDPSRAPARGDHWPAARVDSQARVSDGHAGGLRRAERRFVVVVPLDRHASAPAPEPPRELVALEQRVQLIEGSLRRLDPETHRLRDHELAALLGQGLDPGAAEAPDLARESVPAPTVLASTSGLEEQAGWVFVGGRFARTIALSRYPARLQPGLLSSLGAFAGDLDIALHVHPSAGSTAMTFLEGRVAELTSTVELLERCSGPAHLYGRAALEDAVELRERVARGSERLFDSGLYATLWARTLDELDAATRSLEALLAGRIIETHRLLFRMRDGLLASQPLGVEPVALWRPLSTSALSATLRFTASDSAPRPALP